MMAINGVNILVDGPAPAEARWHGRKIEATELFGLFDKHPMSSPGDYWPRVAIRVDDYSETLMDDSITKYLLQPLASARNLARPPECLRFSAVIWHNARKSTRVDNVVLCNSDIKASDSHYTLGALRTYRNSMAPVSQSSGQMRTMGPKMPNQLLPTSTTDEIKLYGVGQHLFSALFMKMGYQGPLDGDPRLWFLSTAKKS